jgi:hypothetical protein
MTTQFPQPPPPQYVNPEYAAQQQSPPVATYPTAPPWAAAVPAPAGPAEAPLPPYGQLLVPFPEEMQNASRAKAPAWWPIVLWTMFSGLFGLISASRRAGHARRNRNSAAPYWITWAVSFVAAVFLWNVIIVPTASTLWTGFREGGRTEALQNNIVKDGQLQSTARLTAVSAQCEPTAPRTDDGLRRYTCLLKLDDGRTGTLDVKADRDGKWTAVPMRK